MARHEFALFITQPFSKRHTFTIDDRESVRRLNSVLRIKEGEVVHLFNREESVRGTIKTISKRSVEIEVLERFLLRPLEPSLTILLPTLKKDDCEEALSRLTALGVSTIQFVETEKVHCTWKFDRERERFERVMIAAAEQSKQLVLPQLLSPLSLEKALEKVARMQHKIFFDPDGKKLLEVMSTVVKGGESVLFVGPEGDLTDAEKACIKDQGFLFCALTPTVLRACEAIALGAGIVRSLLR